MIERRFFLGAGLAAGLIAARPLAAADVVLRLLHDPFPPFVDAGSPGGGMAVEIVRMALARAHFTLSHEILPWARALSEAIKGKADGMISAWYSEERDQHLAFSEPYLVNRVRFFRAKGGDVAYTGPDSLKGRTIAVVNGYAYADWLMVAPEVTRHPISSLASGLRMVHAGRVDLMPEDELVAAFVLKREAPDLVGRLEAVGPPVSENGMRLAITRQRNDAQAIVTAFNQAIADMRADGALARIVADFVQA